jgi:ATP-dependent helicase/nuclease subunit A
LVRKLGREYVDKNVHNNLYEHLKAVAVLGEAGKVQEQDVKQLSGKCALFLAKLTEYRDKSSVESLYDLCWEMIYDSGYYDYVGTMPAGAQRQANLNVLLERAAGYGKSSYSGLFNFLRYIERLKKFDEDFAEGAASLDNENLVRIMSIHKSKGLYTFSSASYTFTPEETIPSISFASLSASISLVVASSSFSEDIRITSVLLLTSSP